MTIRIPGNPVRFLDIDDSGAYEQPTGVLARGALDDF